MDAFVTARLDQAAATLRDDLDRRYPLTAELLKEEASKHHVGAAHVVQDLIEHRGDYNELLLRLWSWDTFLHEGHR